MVGLGSFIVERVCAGGWGGAEVSGTAVMATAGKDCDD